MYGIDAELSISNINASVDRGGWECRFTAMQNTQCLQPWQNLCVTWRPGFGAPPGSSRIAFNGWVIPERFRFDAATSQLDGLAQTSDGILRRGWIQGCGFSERPNPVQRENYHQFTSAAASVCPAEPNEHVMKLGKMVRHILGYYDTCDDIAIDIRDDFYDPPYLIYGPNWVAHTSMVFHPTENPHGWIHLDNADIDTLTARTVRYAVRETNNLWSRLREIARNEFFEILFDKNDVLWYQPHPMYGAVLPNPVMEFDQEFCTTPPEVVIRDVDSLRQVKLHAVTDDSDTIHANYPALPTHTYGNVLNISRIRCNNVATLRRWAERKFKYENRPFTVHWKAPGLCGLLFELLDRVTITYTGTDVNGVHIDWFQRKFWIDQIQIRMMDGLTGETTFILEAENL